MKPNEKNDFSLALVTGASSGIGEALCDLLASKKINLLINGRNTAKLKTIALKLRHQVNVTIIPADLAEKEGRHQVLEKIYEYVPDLIINCAGFGFYGEALTYETESQMEILNVNGSAVLELTLEAARALVSSDKKGVILNVSSVAPMFVFPYASVYSAAKAFVNQLSESLDFELKPHGVRVLASCPGVVATQFRRRASGGYEDHVAGPGEAMSPAFAAREIWYQIEKRKRLHIFNWKYRLAAFLAKYLLPTSWVARSIGKNIESRHAPRTIVKRTNIISHDH